MVYRTHLTISFVLSLLIHVTMFTIPSEFGSEEAGSGTLSLKIVSIDSGANEHVVLSKKQSQSTNKIFSLPTEPKTSTVELQEMKKFSLKSVNEMSPLESELVRMENLPTSKASHMQPLVEKKEKPSKLVKKKINTKKIPVRVATVNASYEKSKSNTNSDKQQPPKQKATSQLENQQSELNERDIKNDEVETNKQESESITTDAKTNVMTMRSNNSALRNTIVAPRKSQGKSKPSFIAKSDVGTHPVYESNPTPTYPVRARELGQQGTVILLLLINVDGYVDKAKVSKSSGYTLLDKSALITVERKWQFIPGTLNGKPVASWVRVPVKFNIRGG